MHGSASRRLGSDRVPRGAGCRGTAFAEPTTPAPTGGGATFEPPPPPPEKATLVDGRVIAPASAPARIKRVIAAANRLVEKPYIYGGGHKPYSSAPARSRLRLLRIGVLCAPRRPLPALPAAVGRAHEVGPVPARARWITVYTSPSHAYVVIAGLRFDTSMHDTDAPGPAHRAALEQDAAQVQGVRRAPSRAATEPPRIPSGAQYLS